MSDDWIKPAPGKGSKKRPTLIATEIADLKHDLIYSKDNVVRLNAARKLYEHTPHKAYKDIIDKLEELYCD